MNPDSPSTRLAWKARERSRRPGDRRNRLPRLLLWTVRWLPSLRAELPGLRAAVTPGSTCVNFAAAGVGYSVILSALAGPTGRVHHVEPQARPPRWPVDAALLCCGNVAAHHIGVTEAPAVCGADADCLPPPPVPGEPPGEPADALPMFCGGSCAERPAEQTLDNLVRWVGLEKVDFLVIMPGAGRYVLTGAFQILLRDRPALLVRTGALPPIESGSLVRGLTGTLGYRMYRWIAGGWQHTVAVTEDCCTYLFRAPSSRFRHD